MSKLLPFSTIKKYFCINLVVLATLCICMSHAYSQAVSISPASGGLSTSPLTGGSTDQAIFGVQLTKDAVAANTVTAISFGLSSNPAGKFSNPRLYESTDATFSGVGTETLIASGTLSATNVSFSGAPLTNFDGAGAAADNEFFFVVVDVDAAATGTITPSLASSGVTVSTSSVSGSTITGPAFDFLTADFTQNADDPSAVAGDNGVTLLDFTVNSNGTQSLNSTLTFTFDTDVTNILENFDFQVGGATIGGVVTYPLTGGGSILTVTGFNSEDVTNPTTFTLLADIKAGATSGDDFIISLASSGVTISPGIPEAFAPFTNSVDVTGLEADFTQNADDATAFADQNGITLLGFTVNSNGTQSLNSTLTFTFDTDVTNILENFDFQVGGSTIGGVVTYPLTGGGTILTVTGFTSEDVTNATNFTLLADIKAGVTSGDDFTISLASSGVNISPGIPEAFAPFTNSIDVTGLEADFTQNADDATALADQNRVKLLDFTVNSNGTQTLSSLVFTFNKDITNILENGDLEVDGVDVSGASIIISGGGTIATISFTGIDVTNDRVFRLFADIQAGATTTDDFTITLVPGGVNIAPGTAEAFGTFSNSIDIVTSQNSDIIFTSGSGISLNYRNRQATTIHNTDLNQSFRLGTFQLQDGGGSSDSDIRPTSITSITMQISNPANIRQISLFNETNSQANDDTEITGTEQAMPGSGTVVFTPSTPIRTLTDGGSWNFMVRVTFNSTVTDNQAMVVTITSVTGETNYSGFATVDAGGATSSGGSNHTILVTATKFKFNPAVVSTSPLNTNFGPVTIVAVDGNPPLSNRDLDYNGKIDLTLTSGPGTLTGGGQKTLASGQVIVPSLSINLAGSHELTVSDEDYNDAPDNQPPIEDVAATITITSAASSITQGTTTPTTICYGNTIAGAIPTAFFPLSNIVITEADPAGISGSPGSYTFSITLPAGFVFDQSITAGVSSSGGADINIPAAPHYSYPSSNTVQFSYNLTATANTNTITIGGLKVGYTHPGTASPSPTGTLNITRAGGTANIAGVAVGTTLGTLSASQQNASVSFTVDKAQPTDPPIDANTTTFNANGVSVKLVSSAGSGNVFTGSGVTFSSPDYRFNPNTLSAGSYPITLTQTAASGCQSFSTKTFEVIISGIANLNASYCTNSPVSTGMSVSQPYIDQIMGPGWTFDHFVWYDWNGIGWTPITNPATTSFDPSRNEYLLSYQTFRSYGYPGLAVGFAVCNGTTYLCNGSSNYVVTYQWVDLKTAPSVNFSLPSDIYAYCEDNGPVTLTGSPANSNTITDDFFTASGGQNTSISHSLVSGNEVWVFSPGAVTGVTDVASTTFNITYQYKDPVTACSNTFSRSVTVHDRPDAVPSSDISKVQPGALPPATTSIQLCQGSTSPFSFSASNPSGTSPNLTYNYKWYENSVSPANLKGTSTTFNPPVNTSNPGTSNFIITRERNGCESTATNLTLSVVVVGSPVAPTPNFTDGIRQYCVNGSLDATHLGVPGTNLKWYDAGGQITPIANPNQPTEAELSISLGTANVYSFNVTQTEAVNFCEGPATPLTVTVKALPVVSIATFPGFDATKICTSTGDVRFIAKDLSDPSNPAPNGIWSGTGLAGALNEFPSLGEVELDPSSRLPGTYNLQYLYTNSALCSNTGSISVTILPTITTDISVGDVCDGSSAIIENESTINNGTGQTSTIATAEWTFGDGVTGPSGAYLSNVDPLVYTNTSGTYQNPEHIYPNTGTFQITGIQTTSDGCPYAFPSSIPVNVSPLPVANFISENVCVNSQTNFTASTSIPVQTYDWNFSTEGVLNPGISTGATNIASFTYTTTGKDSVELIVTTAAGCQDVVIKPIYSVPNYTPITSDDSYIQGFASTTDGWLTGGSNSSWQLVTPSEAPAPLTGRAWDTKNDVNNENSWVMSGCFDFSSSTKPVISLNIWSDVPTGVDGAVLQYNLTGNIEDNVPTIPPNLPDPDGDWKVVGEVDSGINWYDENGISNNPGSQTTVSAGWSGKYNQWRKAIYKLDDVIGQSHVVFRVSFASSIPRGNGFTFDSVFVGERSRVVLLENFTNSSTSPSTHNTDNYAGFKNASLGQELVKVQYHTAFPGDDPVNDLNEQMNNARTAFYGITESPTIRMDGDFRNGNINGWINDLYDDRVLTPAGIRLNAVTTKVGENVEINVTVENTTSENLDIGGLHIFTVVVEKIIYDPALLSTSGNAQFIYVAKQMLPSPAGFRIPSGTIVSAGQTYIPPTIIWEGSNGNAVVVFIQSTEVNNKTVHQAFLINNPDIPDAITATEDPLYAEKINLYPNPANREVNIELPAAVVRETAVSLLDAHGRAVVHSTFGAGERRKTINTADLAGGVYLIQLSDPSGGLIRKKVMVVHQ